MRVLDEGGVSGKFRSFWVLKIYGLCGSEIQCIRSSHVHAGVGGSGAGGSVLSSVKESLGGRRAKVCLLG
jgi:hypothetical protein